MEIRNGIHDGLNESVGWSTMTFGAMWSCLIIVVIRPIRLIRLMQVELRKGWKGLIVLIGLMLLCISMLWVIGSRFRKRGRDLQIRIVCVNCKRWGMADNVWDKIRSVVKSIIYWHRKLGLISSMHSQRETIFTATGLGDWFTFAWETVLNLIDDSCETICQWDLKSIVRTRW